MKMAYIQAAVNLARAVKEAPPAADAEKKKTEPTSSGPPAEPLPASAPRQEKPIGEEPVQKPTLNGLKSRSTIKIPSLADAAAPAPEATPAEAAAVSPSPPPSSPTQSPVSLDQLRSEWKAFAEERRALGKDSEYIALNHSINLSEDGVTIPITLMSPLQEGLAERGQSRAVATVAEASGKRRVDNCGHAE